jgi:hypothetical protein
MMPICDHRYRHLSPPDGPVELVCALNHRPDPRRPGHAGTESPEIEPTIDSPGRGIARDVFCRIGHRRFSRHRSVPPIRGESRDRFAIDLAEPGITDDIRRYRAMLAARPQDPEALRRRYQRAGALILSIDGLRPEEGHETPYIVLELTGERVWFAEPPLSATAAEVHRLIARAKGRADALGKPVAPWVSDEQDAFATGIAAEFPGVPHRYRADQFLRDRAGPVPEADSQAEVPEGPRPPGDRALGAEAPASVGPGGVAGGGRGHRPGRPGRRRGPGVLRRGPRHPRRRPGRPAPPARVGDERRADGGEVVTRAGPGRGQGGFTEAELSRLAAGIAEGLDPVRPGQEAIRRHVATIREVAATLDPAPGRSAARRRDFDAIPARMEGDGDPAHEPMADSMDRSHVGRFAGGDDLASVRGDLESERWIRVAEGPERRIRGRRHAGVRVAQEGATLDHALDADRAHPDPFGVDDLRPHRSAREPECRRRAIHRRGLMRQARSQTKGPELREELGRRDLAVF